MSTTVKVQIQQRIDTASNWTTANPTLLSGEVGWESDTKKYKIGDGSTAWASLSYAPGSGGYTAGTGVSISGSNVITASAVALTTVQTAANETAHLALTTQEGDVVVRSDENKSYVRNSGTAGSMADFTLLATPTDAVLSVNGNTGAITADQLAAAIEAASDSNTFTDADHTKLNGIDASANNYSISTDLLDEDNFATNSATKPPSQQSVKAYVDTADALKANLSGATFTGDVVFTGDAANVTWDKSTDDLIFNDNAKAIFGTSSDGVAIYHDGNDSYFSDTGTGDFYLSSNKLKVNNGANDETMAIFNENGSVNLYYDGSKKFETTSIGITVNGKISPTGNIQMPDSTGIKLGASDDFVLYHYATDNTNRIESLTDCPMLLQYWTGSAYEVMAKLSPNGSSELYWDGSKKFETQSAGVEISGKLTFANDGLANGSIDLGADADLNLYHDNNNAYFDNNTGDFYIRNAGDNPNQIYIQGKGGEHGVIVNGNGSVDLYYANSKKIETTSSGITVTGSVTETSDVSLKNDINTIQNPLELIEQIRGINFTWKNNGMKSMGVIAQDVEKVFPELVHGQEGSKTLQYSGLIGALVESVKELSAKVAALESA